MDKNLKNYLVFFSLMALAIFFFWIFSLGEEPVEKKPVIEDYSYEKPPKYVSDSKLNDTILNSFRQELLGNDYSLLLMLFQADKLDKNIQKMNELELEKYALEVGNKIKENKELVMTRILQVTEETNGKTYKIELEFRDMTMKVINLTILDGMITSPLEKLY